MLQMPRGGSYFSEVPKASTTVRRMWERPHHRAASSGGRSDKKTNGTEQTASDSASERYDREHRERDEQGMTVSSSVSITVGKRQRVETNSSNNDSEHKDGKERVRLRYFR